MRQFQTCLYLAALLLSGTRAYAGDDGTTDATEDQGEHHRLNALQEVLVQGQRTSDDLAREAQREAPNLINLTTAADMQRLPDVNTGEAIRRVPGISLETDTGEGRYINIRGLDADLNSTTFGGLRLPPTNNSSPSGAGRAVAFDSIPSGFVGAIEVTKSNLPEQDAEALGGTIDITPRTVPLDGKPFADVHLGTGLELQRHTWITDLAATGGLRFGGADGGYQPFSLLLTASTYDDRRGIDDAEAGFVDNQSGGVPDKAFAGFEQRYYNYHRERHGYGGDLGFAPSADHQYFVRYYDSGYSESVLRNRLAWNFPSSAPAVDPTNPNGFVTTASFTKTLRDEKEFLDSRVAEIGGKDLIGDATLDYHVGYTRGTYHKPYDYNSNFDNPNTVNASYDNTTLPDWPRLRVLPATAANGTVNLDPANPAGYVLTGLRNQQQDSNDHELGIGINLAVPTHFTSRSDEEFKVGFNARIRNKTGSQESESVTTLPALALASVTEGGNVTYYDGHYQNGPQINGAPLRGVYATAAASGNITGDPVGNLLSNVHDQEDVYALFGQYQFGYGPLNAIVGLRVEQTRATYAGFASDSSGSAASLACAVPDPVGDPTNHVCPVSNQRNYTNYFPSAQLRYELQPDLIVRAAVSSTIARPGFQQVTASTVVDSNGNTTTGNPNLKPTTATGFDLDIEQYLPHGGIASAGIFYKDIRDYIITNVSQVAGGQQKSGGNLGIVDLFSFGNASSARDYGLELNYVQHFKDILPGPLAGLGISANYLWVDSGDRLQVLDPNTNLVVATRPSLLPSTSRNTANAQLLYDQYGLHATLGAYLTSRNIFGLGNTAALDIWTQQRLSVDFGSAYDLGHGLQVYFNAKNLTNTPLKFTEGPGEDRVIQREFYGATLQFGVNWKL